jgi:hypothetical protein
VYMTRKKQTPKTKKPQSTPMRFTEEQVRLARDGRSLEVFDAILKTDQSQEKSK